MLVERRPEDEISERTVDGRGARKGEEERRRRRRRSAKGAMYEKSLDLVGGGQEHRN